MFTKRNFGMSISEEDMKKAIQNDQESLSSENGIIRDENAGDYPVLITNMKKLKEVLAETRDILVADDDNMIWFNRVMKDTKPPAFKNIKENGKKYQLGDEPGSYYIHFIKTVNKFDTLFIGMIYGDNELFNLVKKEIEKKNVEVWIVTKRLDTFSNYKDIDDDHMLTDDAIERLNLIQKSFASQK